MAGGHRLIHYMHVPNICWLLEHSHCIVLFHVTVARKVINKHVTFITKLHSGTLSLIAVAC
jgi:hypothetical protein